MDCTMCAAVVFNLECRPVGAIVITAIIIFFVLTGCYVFLYIPLVIGKPFRVLSKWFSDDERVFYRVIRFVIHTMLEKCRRNRRRRANVAELTELLAVSMIAAAAVVSRCQQVNIFTHRSTICSKEETVCKVQLSEILRINPFKQEACFKLRNNRTAIHEIRATWNSLLLTCEPESTSFTRDTTYHVIDSKRCPHTGSCVGSKCAAVNSSGMIPELEEGNRYPGVTACVESCGGPGCDCFYWSSGCLFYRIYLTLNSPEIYEVFRCRRWAEAAKVKFTHTDASKGAAGNITRTRGLNSNG
ncbi:hypothetical protein ANCDUO_11186 [Ancylostoma duodenale]|uniref:Phlebovirus glycoprotein G2 fusion domain-containing protein n=1 Tax=Ancylostoma duodenale TaxID=51022 RepID=A0A0C2GC09_9BILA|nr:hypothetical protein ANCDUO_11186 [Ancylostoma duodenale]